MTTTDKFTAAGTDQAATLDGAVNAPALITIFDPAGRPLEVAPATAAILIAFRGFKRHQVNLAGAVCYFRALVCPAVV